MRVRELAKALGVTDDTVRYYTRIGLLKPRRSHGNGYKDYREEDMHRLRFVLAARALGFSVDDVGQILAEADKGQAACPVVRDLFEQRLQETEHRFEELSALRSRMLRAVIGWRAKPDRAPTGDMVCHLIEEWT
ncbi:MerR family transcriptional regulator [Permianibacter sp. IMCC34836]|uniref:MerR family transcriptional regulator n=1 Tax=Permianibacter fluminis TaxID=2738515 RepID=UPI0015580E9A|nr:MerR family transcriptional regulator [Permianibacter fluminis]NQD37960.1 MerR family transcriptional regulator [Permianibacter fluminis]